MVRHLCLLIVASYFIYEVYGDHGVNQCYNDPSAKTLSNCTDAKNAKCYTKMVFANESVTAATMTERKCITTSTSCPNNCTTAANKEITCEYCCETEMCNNKADLRTTDGVSAANSVGISMATIFIYAILTKFFQWASFKFLLELTGLNVRRNCLRDKTLTKELKFLSSNFKLKLIDITCSKHYIYLEAKLQIFWRGNIPSYDEIDDCICI